MHFRDQGKTVILGGSLLARFGVKIPSWFWKTSTIGLVSVIVVYSTFVRADTYEFSPSSCLGNWEGVQNALGEPDLDLEANIFKFTRENSARFSGGDAQRF